jgi:hypothetical protein
MQRKAFALFVASRAAEQKKRNTRKILVKYWIAI